MSKLTRLFIDAMNENVEALPKRLADLGVRYPQRARGGVRLASCTRSTRATTARACSEIDPLQVIREAFALIYSMNLRLPTRFVLLDKAIATVGSVGVDLYPDFNVFEVAKPYARVADARALHAAARARPRAARGLAARARWRAELPYQIHETLEQVRDGQIEVGFVHKGLDEFMHKLDVLVEPARDRARRHRRPDRLEPDRHLREERARTCSACNVDLGVRLPALGRARRVAALGRDPLRPALTRVATAGPAA